MSFHCNVYPLSVVQYAEQAWRSVTAQHSRSTQHSTVLRIVVQSKLGLHAQDNAALPVACLHSTAYHGTA